MCLGNDCCYKKSWISGRKGRLLDIKLVNNLFQNEGLNPPCTLRINLVIFHVYAKDLDISNTYKVACSMMVNEDGNYLNHFTNDKAKGTL